MIAAVSLVLVSAVLGAQPGAGLGTSGVGPGTESALWRMEGPLKERVDAVVEHWLIRAPATNPGLLGLFERRDRLPRPEVVPWAGEFAGKYLIGAVEMLRLVPSPELEAEAGAVAEALYGLQAEDGYLGVFPKDDRLLGHWDLWNHYHVLLGLLLWGDYAGDPRAAEATERAMAKLWEVYGEGGRRPIEAGSPEVNFGIYHLLARLHRNAPSERLSRLIQIFEEDMTQSGDWLRLGAEGVPYWRLPKNGTRWESLHLVQGFYERYRDTGDQKYRDALVQLWTSIRDYDRHPSGAFSTNESASGSVYRQGSIETCCSIAWMALSVDMLRLTQDSTVADELELTFWNEILASHHPSGSWCTYNTPLNGQRRPAFHDINFQWRPGYPELNCCSANSPRGFSMLPDWGITAGDEGVFVNFYGPSSVRLSLPDHTRVELTQETRYPAEGSIALRVGLPAGEREFPLHLRIPAWTAAATVLVNGRASEPAAPGAYHAVHRKWADGDTVQIEIQLTQRHWTGTEAFAGRAALYRGPLLLAYDPQWNDFDTEALLPVDVSVSYVLEPVAESKAPGQTAPLVLLSTRMENGQTVRLCDFATAGATGTECIAWLPAIHARPPENRLIAPDDQAEAAPGPVLFRWGTSATAEMPVTLLVAMDAAFQDVVAKEVLHEGTQWVLEDGLPAGEYFWRADLGSADVELKGVARSFRLSASAQSPFLTAGPGAELLAATLDGGMDARYGRLLGAQDVRPAPDKKGQPGAAAEFNGATSELVYAIAYLPESDYSAAAWFQASEEGREGLQQILSCWCAGMDDPLRISFEGNAVNARMEAGGFFATEAAPVVRGQWHHVAAVKAGDQLHLYLDGTLRATAAVPVRVNSRSMEVGIGCNPHYAGEWFEGIIDEPGFWARALSEAEVAELVRTKNPR